MNYATVAAVILFILQGFAASAAITSRDTNAVTVRVLVINYDPILKNGSRLSRHLHWNDPRLITTNLLADLRACSGGYARYEIVDFIDVDAFPQKRDGFRYTEESFLQMWKDRKQVHKPDGVSYAAIFKELNLIDRIKKDDLHEIWLWGAPYFGTDEYAMKIPGDQVFYSTDNPWFYRPYDIPDCGRTVWVMGFNYEVGEDNALHSFGHRVEGILSLTVGRGIWDGKAGETNAWSRFTRQATNYPDDAQAGNVHGGPNAKAGYDYGQTNAVLSGADDWFAYPHLNGAKQMVNADTWGKPHHLNFMKWWLNHLPKNAGTTDGFYNNWWRYVADYDHAVKALPPPDGRPHKAKVAMY
jgi:hypothetical protein